MKIWPAVTAISLRLLPVLLLLPWVVMPAGCSDETVTEEVVPPPVLTTPIVDLSAVTRFYPFGYSFVAGRRSPAYEFRTSSGGLPVYAAAAGTVENIIYNGASQNDYEIHVSNDGGIRYLVIYDHVRSVEVSIGDAIAAGARLGIIGSWSGGGGRIELQVNYRADITDSWLSVCPATLGSASFNDAHDAAFAARGTGGSSVCIADQVVP